MRRVRNVERWSAPERVARPEFGCSGPDAGSPRVGAHACSRLHGGASFHLRLILGHGDTTVPVCFRHGTHVRVPMSTVPRRSVAVMPGWSPTGSMAPVDELAQRYILLVLRLDRVSPGLIDSYVGPSELREIVRSEPVPLAAELHDESMALAEMASRLDTDDPASGRRRHWFDAQLRAVSALARRAGGEEITYLDLMDELFGVPIRPVPEQALLQARSRLEAILPGSGALDERLAAHRELIRIPPEKVVGAMRTSAGRFRAASARDFELPTDETIEWGEAHDQPWGANAEFLGNGVTRIRVNIDLPMDVAGAALLAAHEAYPGHHAEHVVKEKTLVREAGLGEATLRTMSTPEATLSEGQADVAREIVMGNLELAAELDRVGREVGVEADWPAVVAIREAHAALQDALGNAGILLHAGGRSEADVRAYLSDVGAVSGERLDHVMRVLRDPVNGTWFPYTEGARLIRPWLETQGQTSGFWRLLSEQLTPATLRQELGQDPDQFPGDLV